MVTDDKATAINSLIEAVETIEKVLGLTPFGVYSDVRVRLDILESRINSPGAPIPDGYNPFFLDGYGGVSVSTGLGFPTEDRLPGSLYLRKDGYSQEGLYSRRDGYWRLVPTETWLAGGDLDGYYHDQTVIGIQGRPVSPMAPDDGYALTWNSFFGKWRPEIVVNFSGDLSGNKMSQTVTGLQGNAVSATMPDGNEVLTYHAITNHWRPQRTPILFDTIVGGNNIKLNLIDYPSIIDNSQIGIVNLGPDGYISAPFSCLLGGSGNAISGGDGYSAIVGGSSCSITGSNNIFIGPASGGTSITSAGECAIVCGDACQIIGTGLTGYSIIGTGSSNSISSGSTFTNYAVIGSGVSNSINSLSLPTVAPFIGTGNTNSIVSNSDSSDFATILNGAANGIDSAPYASILGGSNNVINSHALFSTILNGDANNISAGHALIFGSGNINSGVYGVIFGNNNNNSGLHGTILGVDNTITGGRHTILIGHDLSSDINASGSILVGHHNSSSSVHSAAIGYQNTIGLDSDFGFVIGNNNSLDGYASVIFGSSNTVAADYSFITGNGAVSRILGQHVQATNGLDGKSQYSRLILDGYAASGGAFNLSIPGTLNSLSLEDGKSYDICVRILIVNTPPGTPTCARYVYDVLAHQESGTVYIDANNVTLINDSGTLWTVAITGGAYLTITVDNVGSVDDIRAIATVEWRELSRT